PVEDRGLVQEWAGVLFDITASTPREKARRGFALFAYMAKLVRCKTGSDDLLGELVAAHEAGALTETELIDLALAILTAGYETTVGQLGMSVLALLHDPQARDAFLCGQTPAGLLEEYLRLTPATPMSFPRVAVEEVELGGVRIEAGQAVVVSLLHANLN